MTQGGVFAHPFGYWVGMNTDPRTTPEALAEFNHFYDATHVHEVIAAHPGFVSVDRYELVESDAPGGEPTAPRWLAVYAMADESAALQYLKDDARPWLHRRKYSPWPAARRRAKTVWRMLWRQIWAAGAGGAATQSIFVVGMRVPTDDPEALTEFNTFYDRTHAPEVMAQGGYTRATRFELYRAFAPPGPECARFCAVYEAAELRGRPALAGLSPGPSVWDSREVSWRLVYRRLPRPE